MRARVSGGRSFWPIGSVWIDEAERFQYSVELFTKNNLGIAPSCRALSSKEASAEQHRLDDPSGLRDPKDQGAGGRGRAFERMTTQKGEEVANAGQTRRDDIRVARPIAQLIEAPGLELALKRELPRHPAIRRGHERPICPRDHPPRAFGPFPNGQHRIAHPVLG